MLYTPVSYTHLDVYKRQAITHPEPNLNLLDRFLVMMGIQGVPVTICSVSYTHLDVYKRQFPLL